MKKNIRETVREAILPTVTELGYDIWDVTYSKVGADYHLEITIDSERRINIEDCEKVHSAIDPILDELDPIEESYCLQVASAGTVRPLGKEEHIRFACDNRLNVTIGLYVAVDGSKEYCGVIDSFDSDSLTLVTDGIKRTFEKKQISKINAEFEHIETNETAEQENKENEDE